MPGSRGARASRVSGRLGGHGLIRKYGIMMKRQEMEQTQKTRADFSHAATSVVVIVVVVVAAVVGVAVAVAVVK